MKTTMNPFGKMEGLEHQDDDHHGCHRDGNDVNGWAEMDTWDFADRRREHTTSDMCDTCVWSVWAVDIRLKIAMVHSSLLRMSLVRNVVSQYYDTSDGYEQHKWWQMHIIMSWDSMWLFLLLSSSSALSKYRVDNLINISFFYEDHGNGISLSVFLHFLNFSRSKFWPVKKLYRGILLIWGWFSSYFNSIK